MLGSWSMWMCMCSHVLSCCVIQYLAVSGLVTLFMRSSPIPSRLRHLAFIFLEFSFRKKVLPVITSHLEPFFKFSAYQYVYT